MNKQIIYRNLVINIIEENYEILGANGGLIEIGCAPDTEEYAKARVDSLYANTKIFIS